MLAASEEVCSENKKMFQDISLSRVTIARRVEDLSKITHEQLVSTCERFKYYSLAFDESCDMTDTAQLLIFIRGVNSNFEITQELAAMRSMKGRTTGTKLQTRSTLNLRNNIKLGYFFTLTVICCRSGNEE